MQTLPNAAYLAPLTPMLIVGVMGCVVAFQVHRARRPLVLAGAVVVTLSVLLRGAWLLLLPNLFAVAGPADWIHLVSHAQPFIFGAGILLMAIGAVRPVNEGVPPAPSPGWQVAPGTGGAAPTYSLPPNSAYGPDGGSEHGGRP